MGVIFFYSQVKSLGTSIATCCMFSSCFISLILYVPSVENLGLNNTFFLLAAISLTATIFIYFTVKETKGVKFNKVQEMYEKGYLYKGSNKN